MPTLQAVGGVHACEWILKRGYTNRFATCILSSSHAIALLRKGRSRKQQQLIRCQKSPLYLSLHKLNSYPLKSITRLCTLGFPKLAYDVWNVLVGLTYELAWRPSKLRLQCFAFCVWERACYLSSIFTIPLCFCPIFLSNLLPSAFI